MEFSLSTYFRSPTVVRHQGMVIVLALDENRDIYYRVLALDPAQPDDDKSWSDRKKLGFPDQIRPAGMSLVTVELDPTEEPTTAERTADAPFQAVSDGKHVYLFRQSTDGTLYVDRFVFDPALRTLNPAWEARFQRSRKRDVPASRKDTLGARDMEGRPFLEPTTELTVVNDLQDGRFCVLLLPGRLPSEWRWQIFVTNFDGEIDSFSIGRGEDGLFDMADLQRRRFKWADTRQRFQAGPAALLYMQQEEAEDEYGRPQRVKRSARVMLAAPVGSSRYALELDGVDDYVSVGKHDSLQIEGDVTIEAWVKPQTRDGLQNIVAHGAGGVYLRIESGQYQIGVGDRSASYAIPQEDVDTWIHLAGAYDSGQGAWLLFRKGIQVAQTPMAGEADPTGAVTGAEDWTIGRSFAGQINNVRLWNVARTEGEILQDMHRHLAGDEPDLVGYWPFDEGAGDTVHDRASGNDGRLHVGYFLELDGADDYVSIPDHSSINFGKDDDFTVAVWVKAAPKQRRVSVIDNMIVEKWSGRGGYPYVIRYFNRTHHTHAGKIVARRYDGSRNPSIISNTVVNDGRFHHIAFTKKGSTLRLYIDGLEEGQTSDSTAGRTENDSDLYVGVRGDLRSPFSGQINKLRIWDRALSNEEIRAAMDKPAREVEGAVGNWGFDEGSGVTLYDRASENHGQLHVGYALEHALADALAFDGVDDYVHIEDFEWLAGGPVTVEFWAKVNAADVRRGSAFTVGAQNNPNRFHVHLPWHNRNLYWDYGHTGGAGRIQVNYHPYLDKWTHVALVSEGNNGKLRRIYLDGKLVQSKRSSDGPNESLRGLWIGKWNRYIHKGQVADFRIWNRVRSANEIKADMRRRLAGDEKGLVGYWPLDEGWGDAIHDRTAGHIDCQLYVGSGDNPNAKWVGGPGPIPVDNPDDKWREGGPEDPIDKWVVGPHIAILDLGVSRQGTLALIGEMEEGSEVTLALNGDDDSALLCVPVIDAGANDMPTVAVDKEGLTVSAGLLNFARGADTPFLLDGADGLIHLYFRGDHGMFLVAQHDTLTARAEYTLPLDGAGVTDGGPRLHFTARRPGTQMQGYEIAIADGADRRTCQVTIDNDDGIREAWQNVPRDLESFLAVLTGTATNDANDPLVQEGELVFYDYGSHVQREGVPDLTSTDNPFFGSTLFAVGADNLPDTGVPITVRNVDAAGVDRQLGRDCAWVAEPEGKALRFDGADDYVALPHDRLAVTGDLAVEAWVKMTEGVGSSDPLRLINYHRSKGAKFTMGLIKHGTDFRVFAASEGKAAQTADAQVSPDEWTHLAAVYNATNALNLDGKDGYVDCGNDVTLDMTGAMTVEAWVTPKTERLSREEQEVVLSKWGATEDEQSWRLYIDTDDKPCFETIFETIDRQRKVKRVKADVDLKENQPYHLAAVFDGSPRKEWVLDLDGTDGYVSIPNHSGINFGKDDDFTVAVWVKAAPKQRRRKVKDNVIVEKWDGQDGYPYVIRYLNRTGKISARRSDGTRHPGITSYTVVNDGRFHHIAFTKEGSTLRLYIDGLEEDQMYDSTTEPTENDSDLYVGVRGDKRFPFDGQISNLRIWARALSIEEIRESMYKPAHLVKGTVGNWAFDESDADIDQVQDRSGSNSHGTLEGTPPPSFEEVDRCRSEQRILVDGEVSGDPVTVEAEVALTTTKVNIGCSASEEGHFQGIVDDVRLWDVAREDLQIRHYRDQLLPGDAEGLVGDWRFEEGRGKTAIDSKGSNHGRLVHSDPEQIEGMWTDAALNARLTLYVNGRPVQASDDQLGPANFGGYGTTDQFTIGAMLMEDKTPWQHMSGCVDEVRVWNEVRSPEQIRDNMYRALSGAEEGLAGYWPLDEREGTTVHDQTGSGQDGSVKEPQWVASTAPIGNEGPEVRNVYGGLEKPGFTKQIAGAPAVVEYGDMQWDDEGDLFGVMKRCYIFEEERSAALQLVTGFKVGDLELNFVGQVQTAPTLIGYIEGAPPVPSENLTVNDPASDSYSGTSAIELTEAKETIQVYSASRDTGFDMSVDIMAGLYWAVDVATGEGVSTTVFQTEGKLGLHRYFELSVSQLRGASKTAGTSKTLTKSLALAGSWEEAHDYDANGRPRYLNPEVGRRYLPNNVGYALVKSGTADLFALRLKRTGSLVAFQILPNPDIPEDWNIIMFPLNPKYVKNGTLDGMVGLVADPHYPNANEGERGSYFKPLEAYALKEQIEREAKQIEGYYDSFATAASERTGARGLWSELPEGELDYDWETGRDRRSMANTYVWTADGGFYAEQEQFSSIRQESLGGAYQSVDKGGVYAAFQFAVFIGGFFELDALLGGHINVELQKSKEEKAGFGLHVDVQGEGFLNKWEGDPDKQQGCYTAEPCPGKVDAYRFMTFYLAPKPQSFDRFFEEIVDPEWLDGQGKYAGEYDPNARALREARYKPNQVWRVLHRVTYVSRIPPEFERMPVEAVPKDVRRPTNIVANMGLIQEIERVKHLLPPRPGESHLVFLGRAADQLFVEDAAGDGQGELAATFPRWASVPMDIKKGIRQDVMTYLRGYYEIDPARPDWQPAVE